MYRGYSVIHCICCHFDGQRLVAIRDAGAVVFPLHLDQAAVGVERGEEVLVLGGLRQTLRIHGGALELPVGLLVHAGTDCKALLRLVLEILHHFLYASVVPIALTVRSLVIGNAPQRLETRVCSHILLPISPTQADHTSV